MAGHFAISPQEDDVVIRQRLLTRATVTRGEPPLKKLVKRFSQFAQELEKEGGNFVDLERAARLNLAELAAFELPLAKTAAVAAANQREQLAFQDLQRDLDREISQVRAEIENHVHELETAKSERKHKEECEAIRRLIAAQPPRAETEGAIFKLLAEQTRLETENGTAARTLDLRKKQFALLLHAVDELQSAIEEKDKGGEEDDLYSTRPGNSDSPKPMEVETS